MTAKKRPCKSEWDCTAALFWVTLRITDEKEKSSRCKVNALGEMHSETIARTTLLAQQLNA